MAGLAALRERTQKVFRTAYLKIRHPSVKTDHFHLVRPGTEIILQQGGSLRLGRNVSTYRDVTFSVLGGTLSIGSDVTFNRNDIIVCYCAITIGSGCAFGPNVVIYDHDHRFSAEGFQMKEFKTGPIVIEDGCWIGANVTILRGTRIGKGSVIGAGAIVKGDIPPHSLVTGGRDLSVKPLREG